MKRDTDPTANGLRVPAREAIRTRGGAIAMARPGGSGSFNPSETWIHPRLKGFGGVYFVDSLNGVLH